MQSRWQYPVENQKSQSKNSDDGFSIEEMYKFASARLNMTSLEFFSHTPREIQMRLEGLRDKEKIDLENMKMTIAFGIGTAFKGKNIEMFSDDTKINVIDSDVKKKNLKSLFDEFER